METDDRFEAMAQALQAELFFRRHGVMPDAGCAGEEARALARVALLVADADAAALARLREQRAIVVHRLFADSPPGRADALVAAGDLL